MWRLSVAAVTALVASALALGPAEGAGTVAPLPKYMDSQVNVFAVFANAHWKLGGTTSNARQFQGVPAASNYGYAIPGGDVAMYMWAHRCPAGGQRVEFDRTVWLPGSPRSLKIGWQPSMLRQHRSTWAHPLSSVRLLVNGRTVAANNGSAFNVSITNPTELGVLHLGNNHVTLIVRKRVNPSYISTCGGTTPNTRLGVQLALIGQGFPTDLGVRAPTTDQKVQWFHVQPGSSQAFVYTFHVDNHGPSASRAGRFGVFIQPSFMVLSQLMTDEEQAPFSDCSVDGRNVECNYDRTWFLPGRSPSVRVLWKVTAPTDSSSTDVEQMLVSWGVGSVNGQNDPHMSNNSTSLTVYFCYPAATAYGCDKH